MKLATGRAAHTMERNHGERMLMLAILGRAKSDMDRPWLCSAEGRQMMRSAGLREGAIEAYAFRTKATSYIASEHPELSIGATCCECGKSRMGPRVYVDPSDGRWVCSRCDGQHRWMRSNTLEFANAMFGAKVRLSEVM